MGMAAALRLPPFLNRLLLSWYVRHYRVDLSQYQGELEDFTTLDDLFVRRLRAGARPMSTGARDLLSPVDAQVAGTGTVNADRIPQSRRHDVQLSTLLAGPHPFEGGSYAVFYLSPPDYHWVHLPLTGKLTRWTYRPGRLFPVFSASADMVPDLFARNERLVVWLDTQAGTVAVVLIGAFGVGRISATFTPLLSNNKEAARDEHMEKPRVLERGDELGAFHLGSTVILLFEPAQVALDIHQGQRVLVRSRIGEVR